MNYLSFSGVSISGRVLDPIFENSIKIKNKSIVLREFLANLIVTMNSHEKELGFLGISLAGSHLTNLIAGRAVYTHSNDVDFRLMFTGEESSLDLLITRIREVISSVVQNIVSVKLNFKSWMLSKDHSLTVFSFQNALKDGPPIEFTAHVISSSCWRVHRTVMDSFYIHLDAVDKEEYLLSSFEGDVSTALEDARIGKITLLSHASIHSGGLVHYFLLITEGSFEEGDRIYQAFFAQDIYLKKNVLVDSFILHINKKRHIPSYLFFFLLNVLFHFPSDSIFRADIIEKIKKVLEGSLETQHSLLFFKAGIHQHDLSSSNAFFTLNLPFLSDKVALKNHLGKDQLQCEFVIEGARLYVMVPFLAEDFSAMQLMLSPNALKDKELAHFAFELFKNAKLSGEVKFQIFLFLKDCKYVLALATLVLQGSLPVIDLERIVSKGVLRKFLELPLHVENKNKLSVGVIRQVLESLEGSRSRGFWSALLEVPELALVKKLPEKPWKRLFVQLVLKNSGLDDGERSFLYALKNYASQDLQVEFPDLSSSKEALCFLRFFSLFKDVIFLERFLALWIPAQDDVQILEELRGVLSTLERVTPVILQKANEKHTIRLFECFVFLLGGLKALSFFRSYLEDRIVLNSSKKLIKQIVIDKTIAWEVYQDFSSHSEIALFLEQTFFVGERLDGLQGSAAKLLKRIEEHALEGKGVLSCSLCLFLEGYVLPQDKIASLIACSFQNAQNKDKVFSYIIEHFSHYIPSILDSLFARAESPFIAQEFLQKIRLNQIAISIDVQEKGWLDFLGKIDTPFVFFDDLSEVFLVQYLDSIEDIEKLSFLVKHALGAKLSLTLREKLFRLILLSIRNPLEAISNYPWSDQEMNRWFFLAERLKLMTVQCACVFASKLKNYIDNSELIVKLASSKDKTIAALFKEGMKEKIQQNGILTLLVDKDLFSMLLEDKDLAFAFLQLAVKYYQGKDRKLNKQIRIAAQFVLYNCLSVEDIKLVHVILEMVDHISPLDFSSVLELIFSDLSNPTTCNLLFKISLVFPKASRCFLNFISKIENRNLNPISDETIFWNQLSHHLAIVSNFHSLLAPLEKEFLQQLYFGLLGEADICLEIKSEKKYQNRERIISIASSSLFNIAMAQGEIEIASNVVRDVTMKFINNTPLRMFDKKGIAPDLLVYFTYLKNALSANRPFERISIQELENTLFEANKDKVNQEIIKNMVCCIIENSAHNICIPGNEDFYTTELALFSLNLIYTNDIDDILASFKLLSFLVTSSWGDRVIIGMVIRSLDKHMASLGALEKTRMAALNSDFLEQSLTFEYKILEKCLFLAQSRSSSVSPLDINDAFNFSIHISNRWSFNKKLNNICLFSLLRLLIGKDTRLFVKVLYSVTLATGVNSEILTRIQAEVESSEWSSDHEKQFALNEVSSMLAYPN